MFVPGLVSFCEQHAQEEKTAQNQQSVDEISGLLWGLTKRHSVTSSAQQAGAGKRPLVMISYNWGTQPLAKSIAANLRKLGMDVWLDLDNMNGDVMTAMAEAILQSSAVFILVSSGYIQSSNCVRFSEYDLPPVTSKLTIIVIIIAPRSHIRSRAKTENCPARV